VHDWLVGMRGGERVLLELARMFPSAPIHTLVYRAGPDFPPEFSPSRVRTSWLQHLGLGEKGRYRWVLPVMPWAVKTLAPRACDLLISTSHCVAKAVPVPSGARHICYIHTPMRYMWQQFGSYFSLRRNPLTWAVARAIRGAMRNWDRASAMSVDVFVANSHTVAERVRRFYGREALVIHPPVDTSRFQPVSPQQVQDYYLVVSALVPYKRVELAIEACKELKRRLVVVGEGPEAGRLRQLAHGADVQLVGRVSDREVARLMARCRALIFPGEEDFGITPVECMAAGRPVVALGKGGVTESVVGLDDPEGRPPTGVFFPEPTPQALAQAMLTLERNMGQFNPKALVARAREFDTSHFRNRFRSLIEMMDLGTEP